MSALRWVRAGLTWRALVLVPEVDAFDEAASCEPGEDFLDEVAIGRRLAGDRDVRLTRAEAAEAVRRWMATGRSLGECQRETGINPYRHYRPQRQEAS